MSKEQIKKYLGNELDEQERLRVQMYVAEHPDDPEFLAGCEQIFDSGRIPEKELKKALEKLHLRLGMVDHEKSRRMWKWLAFAAVLLLFPMAGALAILVGNSGQLEYRQIRVPACQTRSVTLSDGSVITLSPGSQLVYPDRFCGKERVVFADGQLFAEIAKDSRHPFVINSADVQVRVYGTRFNFKSYSDAEQIELCLLDGSVRVMLGEEKTREMDMKPGDMLRYDRLSGECSVGSFDKEEYDGAAGINCLRFNNESLSEICAELERYFDIRVVILDDSLAGKRYFSYFTNGETPEQILSILAGNSMNVDRQGERLFTISRNL